MKLVGDHRAKITREYMYVIQAQERWWHQRHCGLITIIMCAWQAV